MAEAALVIHTDWQLKHVQSLMRKLQPPRLNWALRNAVNNTARQVERQAERDVAKSSSIPVNRVRSGIYIRPKATDRLFEATIQGSNSPLPLKIFKTKETRKGLSVKLWGKRETMPHAFIKGGNFPDRQALHMGGHAYERIGKKRLPIEKAWGVSIAEAMVKPAISDALVKVGQERMMANLKRQLDRYARVKRHTS